MHRIAICKFVKRQAQQGHYCVMNITAIFAQDIRAEGAEFLNEHAQSE